MNIINLFAHLSSVGFFVFNCQWLILIVLQCCGIIPEREILIYCDFEEHFVFRIITQSICALITCQYLYNL